ncbi:MAG: DegT/DnrJ/EryC1/StrS family aminotransferase [Candidatus Bathyarchaeota archaeon]|nr:DegT/DnrJ/EryC1/StrS family aminotransferase [Candidatus Bathyarchaeota archaeon]
MKIPIARPDITNDEIEAVIETMKTGWVTQGKKVDEFEKLFASYCGAKYGIATSSGTTAIHVALASIGIQNGDEVITTPLSCISTTNPILYLNAKPVFADVDPETLNLDPRITRKKTTKKTKAMLPVHMFGHPVDLDPILETAKKHGIYVVEDAAHALGARYKGKKVGSIGHIACFSFYGDKIITTAEGGIAITNNEELAEKMRMLRNHGMNKHHKFRHPILGYNYKMSDIHAAIGIVQMRKLEEYIQKRRTNVEYLNKQLNGLELKLPTEQNYAFNVYYVYHLIAQKGTEKAVKYLEKQGIETRPLLSLIPEQPPYQNLGYNSNDYAIAKDAHQKGFYVSNSPLLTPNELQYIASALKEAFNKL